MSPPDQRVVAVTGASGFIGSHLCKNLVDHGYRVRACVRDKNQTERTKHLLSLNNNGNVDNARGGVELFSADMMVEGSYDHIFDGCSMVFHVAGNFGTDPRWTDASKVKGRPSPIAEALLDKRTEEKHKYKSYHHGVYDSYLVSTKFILDSVLRNKESIRRFVYTSSGCAGSTISAEPADDDYTIEENAYGKGKVDCERLIYAFGEEHGIVCCSSCPFHVLGPLLSPIHDVVYQHRLGEIFAGKYSLDYSLVVADVRDIADTQRRMAESSSTVNGSRYWNRSPYSAELTPAELKNLLHDLFPSDANVHLADDADLKNDHAVDDNDASSSASDGDDDESMPGEFHWESKRTTTWRRPEDDLGIQIHSVRDTIKDTIISLKSLHLINRQVSISQLKDYYNVAEMDGCEYEMEYILSELKKRNVSVGNKD